MSQALIEKYKYARISTNATTTVFTGPGKLHSIVVNTAGGTATATIFDSTTGSGTTVGVSSVAVGSYIYDIGLGTGLTIVTAGTTPGDITVCYAIG